MTDWYEHDPDIWRKTLLPKNPRQRRGWIDNIEELNDMVWIDEDNQEDS